LRGPETPTPDQAKKSARAESLLKDVLKARTARQGADHPDTLAAKAELAQLYDSQERYDRGEPIQRELVAAWKQKAGADSAEYARSLSALGQNLLGQQKYAQAEKVLRACLVICDRKQFSQLGLWDLRHMGPWEPRTLLGDVLLCQRRYAEAEKVLLRHY